MPARQCGAGVEEWSLSTAANTPPPKVISLVGKTPESVRALAGEVSQQVTGIEGARRDRPRLV